MENKRAHLYDQLRHHDDAARKIRQELALHEARDALRHADDKLCEALCEPTRHEILAKERKAIGGPMIADQVLGAQEEIRIRAGQR